MENKPKITMKANLSTKIPEENNGFILLDITGYQPDYSNFDDGFQRSIIFDDFNEALRAVGYFLHFENKTFKVYEIEAHLAR